MFDNVERVNWSVEGDVECGVRELPWIRQAREGLYYCRQLRLFVLWSDFVSLSVCCFLPISLCLSPLSLSLSLSLSL